MSLTLLLDLDDTLLDTNLEAFVPAYFQAFSQHMAGHVPPNIMLRALINGLDLMNENENPTRTLQEVFEDYFYPDLGLSKEELSGVVERFYDDVFPALGDHTRIRPDAATLIEWAFSRGFRIAIATDPLMPRKATYRRLGWPDGPVLMVGNDVARDLAPAHRLGLATYLIDGVSASSPGFEVGRGKLADLRPWLESINLSTLEPSFKSRDAILGIMASTPAVLRSFTSALITEQWRHEPGGEDWTLNEIVCHLRDTEREVHRLQLDMLIERPDAFIPRPDTSVWASERDYLSEDGPVALAEFTTARLENLDKLRNLEEEVWSRKARHAIFGPTNVTEIISFVADHDRMHIQQIWKSLPSV